MQDPSKLTLKERADQNYVSELRFLSTRMYAASYMIGFQAAVFAYFGALRHLRRYVGIPLTFVTFLMSRNLAMKSCIGNMYYPIETLYDEVRRH